MVIPPPSRRTLFWMKKEFLIIPDPHLLKRRGECFYTVWFLKCMLSSKISSQVSSFIPPMATALFSVKFELKNLTFFDFKEKNPIF